jgi:pilus assembly protein CpaC
MMSRTVQKGLLLAALIAVGGLNARATAQTIPPESAPQLAQAVPPATAPLPTRTVPSQSGLPVEVVGPSSGITVETGRGTLLRLRAPASTVFVAEPDIADVQVRSPELIYVFGRRPGDTTIYAVGDRNTVLANLSVHVTHNLSALRSQIRAAAGDAPVQVSSTGDTIVLSGAVANAAQSENVRRIAARVSGNPDAVVNQLRVDAPNQINLRVRFAEVQRDVLRQLGVNWDAAYAAGNFVFGLSTGRSLVQTGQSILGSSTLAVRPDASGDSLNTQFLRYRGGSVQVDQILDALDREGFATILAEPNLTALSGETATFLAGGEFPIPVPQDQGRITIEFKRFGVSLAFTPTLLDGNRISLRVRPEVSQISSTLQIQIQGFLVPSLTTRRAETTVELASGQSFAIAGLIQNSSQNDVSRVPGLGDLPVIGALFRSNRFRRNETELVMIVTPYIVRPVNAAQQMQVPTDGLVRPNEVERIGGGLIYRQQLPPGQRGARDRDNSRLVGPAGFQLQ